MLRVRGVHFDVGGSPTPLEELLTMDGLFRLKDIKDRLPISGRRLQKMIYDHGRFASCFPVLFKDKRNRGALHVDLKMLDAMLDEQAKESVEWRTGALSTTSSSQTSGHPQEEL